MIEVSANQIDRVHTLLHNVPGGAEKVLKNAMNRGLSTVRTHTKKQIQKEYAIKQRDLHAESTIYLKRLTSTNLAGEVAFSGMRIPLYKFNVTHPEPDADNLVKAAVLSSSAPTPFMSAFIARMSNGHVGIFERTGKQGIADRMERFNPSKHTESIRELYGPAVGQMAGNAAVIDTAEEEAERVIDRRIEHEINRILNAD